MAKIRKPGWEYDEEDEEILGVKQDELMPATAEEALKSAETCAGGRVSDVTGETHTEYLRGMASVYDLLLHDDFDPQEEEQMPPSIHKLITEVRRKMKQEALESILTYIEDALDDILDVEAAVRAKKGE